MSRYYDPVTHRFLNADGYLQAGEDILDVNMFAYCGNNPVCRIDSKGNSWWGIAATAVNVGITASVSSVIVASVAVGTIATGIGVYATSKAISNSKITYSSTTITSDTRNETTTIYRYGGTNPGNFVPSSRDVETNTGLSFSTVPRPGAAMTTIE